ncbi:2-amino-4-hydroxy-6-hydroxymethyldihydropteridine diphosphokinase [Rhodovulum sp. YNF3179]|uniref:2-amino-4-hydroxy-6- hydroxymethyldihydropteridine diphosphokinase n=1 Tax=Rhodovulum sp. YNF3179 TaxID=3425127 RepID=UPI003D327DD8
MYPPTLQDQSGHGNVTKALVALGANRASTVGGSRATLECALRLLDRESAVRVARESRYYHTPAFPPGSGPDFVNAAALLETTLAPDALLALLHRIEAGLGRERRVRWAERSADLDLLAWGDAVLPDRATFERWRALPLDVQMRKAPDELILPHPRLQERAFVLVPLADVAPDWRHPVLGRTVAEMVAALSPEARAEVRPADAACD